MEEKHYEFLQSQCGISKETIDETVKTHHAILGEVIATLTCYLGDNDNNAFLAAEVIQNLVDDYINSANADGGPGSGNWGHEGVEGQLGGSAPGGGKENRVGSKEKGYSSFAKYKKKFASKHNASANELLKLPLNSMIICDDGVLQKLSKDTFVDSATGETYFDTDIDGIECKIAIPNSAKAQFLKENKIDEPLPKKKKSATKSVNVENVSEGVTRSQDNDGNISVSYDHDECYTEERRKSAQSLYESGDRQQVHEVLNEYASDVWDSCETNQKNSIHDYTEYTYDFINDALRDGTTETITDANKERISDMTEAISKAKLPHDMVLPRYLSSSSAEKLLGLEEDDLHYLNMKNSLHTIIGSECQDDAFMSCGSTKGTGIVGRPVLLEIFAPKGTEAMYVAPISAYGGKAADYSSNNAPSGNEFETILQRGTKMVVKNVHAREGGTLVISMDIIGQEYKRI